MQQKGHFESFSKTKVTGDVQPTLVLGLVRRAKISRLVFTDFNLKGLLDEVGSQIQLEADQARVHIHMSCPKGLKIRGDREQIARVFLNLFSNSIFWLETDTKGKRKEIAVLVKSKADVLTITFKDNGPGIAPNAIEEVFDYFYTSKGKRGMGFGLPLSKRIIEAHGGSISVKSRWGWNTEFTIILPPSGSKR